MNIIKNHIHHCLVKNNLNRNPSKESIKIGRHQRRQYFGDSKLADEDEKLIQDNRKHKAALLQVTRPCNLWN
ncbi:unnamed protein product [Lactuca virosa]|uniref:Uncharacterized protein n=1 Tax=Lactuca virosa TaxID=75947 RepID=A0AAU9PSJ4_9ASTR|nr:unnamed protein product [Lactuca virosa]